MTSDSPSAAGISQVEFARQIGVAKSWVTALKAAGRLVLTADGKVDAAASIARIAATADPHRDDVARRHAEARARHENTPTQPQPLPSAPAPAEATPPRALPDEVGNSYQAARAVKEKYAALSARLEYQRAAGKMIDRDAVAAAIEDIVIAMRQGLEQQPHRLAPELVGQDLDSIRATLKRETTAVLAAMSKDFHTRLQQLAGQQEQPA
jgi:hypothetical protein